MAARNPGRRSGFRLLLLICILACGAGGCVPLVPLVASALGGGAGSSRPQTTGPFAMAPSGSQNSRPSNSTLSDSLANADHEVKASCQALLPPPEPLLETGCALRDVCLPGSTRPVRMRVCGRNAMPAELPPSLPRMADWQWAED